ncbi:MAG: hypothetical protein HC837_02515 [Chloroflexaceae bacterium]|nr:hypothetical protein [Chloroflexaceae bacterium]
MRKIVYSLTIWILIGIVIGAFALAYFDVDLLAQFASELEDEPVTITLIQNPWDSAVANNAIAKILLESRLGYQVNVLELENREKEPRMLITGEASANLEVWPSGMDTAFNRYLRSGIIDNIGPLGVAASSNWYVPSYLRAEYPQLVSWKVLAEPEIVNLFKREGSGNKGVFVSGEQAWNSHLEEIIANLNLPYIVHYAGSEQALVTEIERAYSNQEPILFFFWEPHLLHQDYDFTIIELPPYSDECYALIDIGGINCGYPKDILFKVAYPGLKQQAPEAYDFLQKLNFPSNQDQLNLMQAIQDRGSPEAGARSWMRENEAIWRKWLE